MIGPTTHMLTAEEKEIYGWQMDISGFGERGQLALRQASVMISRCGGLGGVVAYELAAAGVGRLILAHGGTIKPSDLNRQLLMTHEGIGSSRMASIKKRLTDLNPRLEMVTAEENVHEGNINRLVDQADLIVDCAPLFEERYLLNRASVQKQIPMVEAAVFDTEFHLTSFYPGKTPCLKCLYPEMSTDWKRRFPVFGAVSGTAGAMAAMEAIKIISGLDEPLFSKLLCVNLRNMNFKTYSIKKWPECVECGHL